jgi:hypothetical protein
MRMNLLARILTLFFFLIAVSAVNTVLAQEKVIIDMEVVNKYPLTSAQKITLERVVREVHVVNGHAVDVVKVDDDEEFDDDDMDGQMIVYYGDIDKQPNEPMPVVDDSDNRVRLKIDSDGDVKYKYFKDNDAKGTFVNYEDDGDIVIEYDLQRRVFTTTPVVFFR